MEWKRLLLSFLCKNVRFRIWGGLGVFEGEETFGGVDDVVGHLFVAAKVVARELASITVNLHVGRRVYAVGLHVPKEEGGLEGLAFEIFDQHTTTQLPQVLVVVEVGGVSGDERIDLEGLVEPFEEETFFKCPVLWFFFIIDIPHLSDEFIADDARVTDKCADTNGTEGGQGVALSDVGTSVLVVVATSWKQQHCSSRDDCCDAECMCEMCFQTFH